MAKVFGIHTIELRPGVQAEDLERFVIEECYPIRIEGVELCLARGDKGKREGKYVLVYEIESIEARDRFAGAPGGPAPEVSEEIEQVAARLWELCTSSFTDYVVLGK